MILPDPKNFNVSLVQIGYEPCPPEHFYGPCKRGFYVLHIIERGSGLLKVRGNEYELKAGDLFLIEPSEVIYYQANPEDPYEYYWFAFQGVGVKELLQNAGFIKNDVYVRSAGEKRDELISMMKELLARGNTSLKNDLLFLCGFYYTLACLTSESTEYTGKHIYNTVYERINLFVELNYMSEIDMNTLADYAGLHRSSVYRFFKRQYNKSPSEYIMDFRLTRAHNLIINSELNIKQIALSCGFNDMSYFSKAFKNKYNTSPRDIRKDK